MIFGRVCRLLAAVVCFALILAGLSGCGRQETGKTKLVVWGYMEPDRTHGWRAAIARYNKLHPELYVEFLSIGAGSGSTQKMMTAIAGNVPPDVIYQGRFTIGDWASRDAFLALDKFVEADRNRPDGVKKSDFYPATWNEAVYKGKVYAIPDSTDVRGLFYNRKMFREAGLDPDKPPRTWDELKAYAVKLTKYNKDGTLARIGYMPNYGNCWFILYSWQNGGDFLSPDGRKCTMNNPRSLAALKYMVDVSDTLGGVRKLTEFGSGFRSQDQDPFAIGQLAMKVDVNLFASLLNRYTPDLDYGVAPPPVPTERYEGKGIFKGKPKFITWSGGNSWSIPRGAIHARQSWEFIKYMLSPDTARLIHRTEADYNHKLGRTYVPFMSANAKINKIIFREFMPKLPRLVKANQMLLALLPNSMFRPVTPVGQKMWTEHLRAYDLASRHKMSAKAALDIETKTVQQELDRILERERFPVFNWNYAIAVAALVALAIGLFLWSKSREYGPMGRLARGETRAAVLFAMPWLTGFVVFTLGPIIASIFFSFCDYDVLHPARWVGTKNYCDLFGTDWALISKSLYNAGYLAMIGLPLGLMVSLSIAMLLNTNVRGMRWYRTIYYLPSIMPVVANAILWIWILDPHYGLVNVLWRSTLTHWLAIQPPMWLADEHTSKPALILMGLWGAGGGMILWLAGLQGIPRQLYEACEIDGAGWWARFRAVTIPMLTPYIFFNVIMGTIGVIQSFDAQFIMTNGGPAESTLVPVLHLFTNAFLFFKMGYASALAWLLFVIILCLTLVQLKLSKKWVYYEGQEIK
ncbi:MAG: extracellular solute-binding protein [Armatimonadetes bacterium]|nr:extracellular solute-binding protein [Armatimonadota bacterium]